MEKFKMDMKQKGANWLDIIVPELAKSALCIVENIPNIGAVPHMRKTLIVETGAVVPTNIEVSDDRFAPLFKSLKPRTETVYEMSWEMGRVSIDKVYERYH